MRRDRELLNIPWDARTVIVINAPHVDPRWLQDAITLDETFHPVGQNGQLPVVDWNEFSEGLPAEEQLAESYFETNWDPDTLPCWPVVICPAETAHGSFWCAREIVFVAGVGAMEDDSRRGRQRFAPVLLRESSAAGVGMDLIVCGQEWASQSWFNDSGSGGPVSWEGGSQLIWTGQGIFLDYAHGDFENHLRAIRLPDARPSTSGEFLADWVAGQQLEQLLAVSGVFDDRSSWVLSADELQRYTEAVEGMYQYSSVSIVAPLEASRVCLASLSNAENVLFVRRFFTDPSFEHREHFVQLLEDSVREQGPSEFANGCVDAKYLAEKYPTEEERIEVHRAFLENQLEQIESLISSGNLEHAEWELLKFRGDERKKQPETEIRILECLAAVRFAEGRSEDAETLLSRARRLGG